VESAEVAGDEYPTTRVLTADGVVSLIGCMMGNPFINAVYIGHPGWKSMGGRIGYSAATGVMVIVLCWFGIISTMLAFIPVIAILPILLYIGMLIGSQAFQETPKEHAPAIVLGLTPHMAAWGITAINGALAAAGTVMPALTPEKKEALIGAMRNEGVLYHGMEILGGGSILGGLILTAIGVFIIDRNFSKAAAFSAAGGVLTFFGFMHGERIGVAQSPLVAIAYIAVAAVLVACAKLVFVPKTAPATTEPSASPGMLPAAE
jgi:AGZA family xanthine/uracil permease-like MFS transporter